MSSFDGELGRLRADNQTLSEELAQCQADKEFVWSLWKRLQVANPDITQAVGLVMQREKEKNEMKDRKVLDILQHKDDQLDALEKSLAHFTKDASFLTAEKVNFQRAIDKLEAENLDLIKSKAQLLEKVSDMTERDNESAPRQAIRELDQANLELKQKNQKLESEISRLQLDKNDLSALRKTQMDRIKNSEGDVDTISTNYNKVASELDEAKSLLQKYEHDLSRHKRSSKSKHQELEAVRRELTELWNTHTQANENANQQVDLIRQLQDIQRDQKQMMRNQEEAFSMESNAYQAQFQLIQAESIELKRQNIQLQEQIGDQEILILDLKKRLNDDGWVKGQVDEETHHQLRSLQSEMDALKAELPPSRGRSHSRVERGSSPVKFGPRQRSKSLSQENGDLRSAFKKLEMTEKRLEDSTGLLHKKNREMEELRTAHCKRLQRLQCLQRSHALLKKQVTLLEDEGREGPRCRKKKKKRVQKSRDPKVLQKEDSDEVWKELTYFRQENKDVHTENMNLHEEVDQLRVKTAHDAATIHELRTCVETEKEELNFFLEEMENRGPSEEQLKDVKKAHKQVAYIEAKLKSVAKANTELVEDNEQLSSERRSLKDEIQRLEERDTEHRMRAADMRRELMRTQREARKRRVRNPTRARQYQRSLNNSIKEMSEIFDEFKKDGWECVTESTDDPTDLTSQTELTANTSESLGHVIVTQAKRACGHPMDSSTPSHRNKARSRVNKECQSVPKMQPLVHTESEVSTRDVALSPIHFLQPSSDLDLIPSRHFSRRDTAVSPIRFPKQQQTTNSRQTTTLRKRIEGLQQQITILKSSKENAIRSQGECKRQLEQLQGEVGTANARLHSQKSSAQKLAVEFERLRNERDAMEAQLEDATSMSVQGHSEQEFQAAQAKVRALTSESSRQVTTVKQLREEVGSLEEKLRKANERVSHVERDLGQKRALMDDMRLKTKLHQENAQSDADMLLDAEDRLKNVSETNARYKTQLESSRQRIAAVTREKYENEEKVMKLSDELDKKMKMVGEMQRRCAELERTVVAMETTAQTQLHQLANQSEEAIDAAQSRLIQANHRLREFGQFLKVLSHSLLNGIKQARSLRGLQQKATRAPPVAPSDTVSLKRAQHTACDILNLSLTDIDDMLSISGDSTQKDTTLDETDSIGEEKKSRKWSRKWERILKINNEFSLPLAELFMEKVDERCKLTADLQIN